MNPLKILLVEDDEFIRDIFREILESSGYNVTTAVDGQEGFDKITKDTWDLVLLDVMMPKMTGIEVMQKIREGNIPVNYKKLVYLTNVDDSKEVSKLTEFGNEYLIKSDLTPPALVDKVKEMFPQ